MHDEFIDVLLSFARRNNLRFSYDYNETLRTYRFSFKNQERHFGYSQEISQACFDLYSGDRIDFAHRMIEEMTKRAPELF